jgi:hypothetical protein
MLSSTKFCRKRIAICLAAIATVAFNALTFAATLQGSVEETDALTRLSRPGSNGLGEGVSSGPATAPLRLGRPVAAPDFRAARGLTGLVDTTAFSQPLSGSATDNGGRLGLVQPATFGSIPNNKFDLGSERGDRQLVLAWETWHHQISAAIYHRWGETADIPGRAALRITVTRDRRLSIEVTRPSGNPAFDRTLREAIMSLDGNPGLTFPTASQRNVVSFEADYVASTNIQPGYSWVKNDYEKVHQSY